jgi:hypothetical protein
MLWKKLSSNLGGTTPEYTYFTSALYPYVFGDELAVGLPSLEGGYMFSAIQDLKV